MIEEALYSQLTGNAGVTAIAGTRVYPAMLPQNVTLPAISYVRVDTVSVQSHSGNSGLARARFQISAWASTFTVARNLAEKIRLALESFRGSFGGTVAVGGILFIDHSTFVEVDGDQRIHQHALDFAIWHEEAVA